MPTTAYIYWLFWPKYKPTTKANSFKPTTKHPSYESCYVNMLPWSMKAIMSCFHVLGFVLRCPRLFVVDIRNYMNLLVLLSYKYRNRFITKILNGSVYMLPIATILDFLFFFTLFLVVSLCFLSTLLLLSSFSYFILYFSTHLTSLSSLKYRIIFITCLSFILDYPPPNG